MSQAFQNYDVTSANAELILTVAELFPAGIQLQMFGTDQIYNADAVDMAETRMGADGYMVAGYTPNIQAVTITLEASSPSRFQLAILAEAMVTNKRPYLCNLIATLPAVNSRFVWSKGVLQNTARALSAARTLQPTTWLFHFERFESAGL
jgi:hypothetical protein